MAQLEETDNLEECIELDDRIVNTDERDNREQQNNDQFNLRDHMKMPRPCYYTLRILGAWQPNGCHWLFNVYSRVAYVILLATMCCILGKYQTCIEEQLILLTASRQ